MKDVGIKELAEIVREVVGCEGVASYDAAKPDGICAISRTWASSTLWVGG
jgi:hypothetical protein